MKPFLIWLIFFILLFGGLSLFMHIRLTAEPNRIIIAFDDSYQMENDWSKIAPRVESRLNDRYTEYFVISNKEKISADWETAGVLTHFLRKRVFRGEYELADLLNTQKYPELKDADKILIFTNRDASSIGGKSNVEIFEL